MRNYKRAWFYCITLGLLLFLNGCKKESIESYEIEGTWGRIHEEYVEKASGKIVYESSTNYNPFKPTSEEDELIDILNIEGNRYMIEFSYWNNKKSSWEKSSDGPNTFRLINNRIEFEEKVDVDGSMITFFTFSKDRLTLEASGSYFEEGQKIDAEMKIIYRKMSSFSD